MTPRTARRCRCRRERDPPSAPGRPGQDPPDEPGRETAMGRTFEALKGSDGRQAGEPAEPPTLRLAPPADAEPPPDEPPMPYIEVGPRRSMEASPEVLAFAPPPAPAAPEPQVAFRAPPAPPSRLAPELLAAHQPD